MTLVPVLAAAASLADARKDPLADYKAASWAQEWVYRNFPLCEIYSHWGNEAGKTKGAMALYLGLLRGEPFIRARDGSEIPLPAIPRPVSWILGVPSFKLAAGSSLAALRELVGRWPHHEGIVSGAQDAVGIFYVKHRLDRSDDYHTWSRLYVFPYEGELPEAMRVNGWGADEPPPWRWLDAVRMRGKAGLPLYGIIHATPIEAAKWRPILTQYPKELLKVEHGRARIQASTYDNEALTPEDLRRIEDAVRGSRYAEARLRGDHVDATGGNPYDPDLLERWRKRCVAGKTITLVAEDEKQDGSGRYRIQVQVEVWFPPDENDVFLVTGDPSSGVRGEGRDPAGIHVWSYRRRCLCARFNGYVSPYGLGRIAADLAKRYSSPKNKALADVEMNYGGLSFLRGLWDGGHSRVVTERYEDKNTGKMEERKGWWNDDESRPLVIDAVEIALQRDDARIFSAEVVSCLANCILDDKDKIVAGPGEHDEDLILSGRAMYLIRTRPPAEPKQHAEPAFVQAVSRAMGRPVRHPKSRVQMQTLEKW